MSHKASTPNMVWMDGKRISLARNQFVALVVGLMIIALVVAAAYSLTTVLRANDLAGIENGIETASARWSALGQYWSAEPKARAADAARWAALGKFYARDYAPTIAADSARWNALGDLYRSKVAASIEAASACWSALGAYHQARYESTAAASSARYQALGEWYAKQVAR